MSREMIVGGEHMVGQSRRHDYDELMELGAEPQSHAPTQHPGLVHQPGAPMHPGTHVPAHLLHPQHSQTPAPTREIHHHYGPPAPPAPEHHRHHEREHEHHRRHEEREIRQHEEGPRRRRLVSEEPTNERQFPIGFMFLNIAPGDEEDIEVKPQVYFRGERLAIPPTIARYFDILDIKVGKDSQLAATGTMPGESFSALAVGVRMELDTAKPGIVITIRVRNVDTVAHDFKAIMYGAVLE